MQFLSLPWRAGTTSPGTARVCRSVLGSKPVSTPTTRECLPNVSRLAQRSTPRFREGPRRSAILAMFAALISPDYAAEQLRDRAHPTSGVNRRVQLVNVGKKFCCGRAGEQFVGA